MPSTNSGGGLRAQGNPWLITDFISLGSPMYFADRLWTRSEADFTEHVARREIVKCPPGNEEKIAGTAQAKEVRYSYSWQDRQVIYDGAPFAAVRWTNLWFPALPENFGFFGDWFGGALSPLFGAGIVDISVRNKWSRVPDLRKLGEDRS